MNRVIILLIFWFSTSCGQTNNGDSNADRLPRETIAKESNAVSLAKDSIYKTESSIEGVRYNKDEEFEILDAIKMSDYRSSDTDTAACNNWTLSNTEMKRVLKNSERINAEVWHHIFQHHPCVMRGQLSQNSQAFPFEINAGAWMIVDEVMYGNFNRSDDKLFVSTSLSIEEE